MSSRSHAQGLSQGLCFEEASAENDHVVKARMTHIAGDVGRPVSKLLAWAPCAGDFEGVTAHTHAAALATAARCFAYAAPATAFTRPSGGSGPRPAAHGPPTLGTDLASALGAAEASALGQVRAASF